MFVVVRAISAVVTTKYYRQFNATIQAKRSTRIAFLVNPVLQVALEREVLKLRRLISSARKLLSTQDHGGMNMNKIVRVSKVNRILLARRLRDLEVTQTQLLDHLPDRRQIVLRKLSLTISFEHLNRFLQIQVNLHLISILDAWIRLLRHSGTGIVLDQYPSL